MFISQQAGRLQCQMPEDSSSVDAGSVSLSDVGAKIQAKPTCNANNGLHQPQMAAAKADACIIPSPVDGLAMFQMVCWHYRYQ